MLAAGLSLVLGAILEPQWLLRVFLDVLPGLLVRTIDLLGIEATTAVALYGLALVAIAVAIFAAAEGWARAHGDAHPALREKIKLQAIATLGFVAGFVVARTIVVLGSLSTPGGTPVDEALPIGEIWLQGYHVHHFFIGFFLLVVAGWLALFHPDVSRRWPALLYGVGVGVFVDEMGLLLTWGNYYERSSWFVAAVFLSILTVGIVWTWGEVQARQEEGGEGALRSRDRP